VVLDTNNYYPERDGTFPELENESTTTSELLAAHLPTSKIVKVFNNIYFKHLLSLARPAGSPDRSPLAIAGDDADAKATATAFLDALGYDAVDVGPLAEGWRYQRDTAAYAGLYGSFGDERGTPLDAATLRSALAAARRYADTTAG
jgi:predicted dinucleotide-binding enzyme